jgi:hypothetical protein
MIRLWDAATGRPIRELTAPQGVACIALAQDGRVLAAGGGDGRIRLWDPAAGQELGELPGHAGGVTALAFGCDGLVLASGGRDGAVRLWDRERRKELKAFTGHAGPVAAVAFAPDNRTVASGGADQAIRFWETVNGEQRARLRGHGGAVTALAFAPGGRTLGSGAWDGSVWLWDAAAGQPQRQLAARGGGVRAVAFTPDGKRLVAAGGQSLRQWEVAHGRAWPAPAALTAAVLAAALAPDGTTLAVGGTDGLIRLWDLTAGEERGHLEGHRGPVVTVAFSPDGRTLASAGTPASIERPGPIVRPPDARPTPVPPAPSPPPPPPPGLTPTTASLTGGDPERFWEVLADPDPRKGLAAVRLLAADAGAALALLRARLRPVPPADMAALSGWIGQLIGTDPASREPAAAELLRLANCAEPALRRVAAELPAGPERNRVEELRARIRSAPPAPELLRGLRAVELLTRIATPEARALLVGLAAGAPEATLTHAAADALAKLDPPTGAAPP